MLIRLWWLIRKELQALMGNTQGRFLLIMPVLLVVATPCPCPTVAKSLARLPASISALRLVFIVPLLTGMFPLPLPGE